MTARLSAAMNAMPLVAILRGLEPLRAARTAGVLVEAGFRVIEVPLNGMGALQSISEVKRAVPADIVVGAGTVLSADQARAAGEAGAELLVMPNLDPSVMDAGRSLGLALMPGVMSPSEAFAARSCGAFALKLFPAEIVCPLGLKALRSVLPKGEALIYPVGGIEPATMEAWREAGADGLGFGGALFKPGYSDDDIRKRARAIVAEWRRIEGK